MSVPLVVVAHGSRDPRSVAAARSVVDRVATTAPDIDVRVSFLDLSRPRVTDVLAKLHAEGRREVVVAPLLLGNAYHARVDLPGLVREVTGSHRCFRVEIAGVLGIDPLLERVAHGRLVQSGADLSDPGLGIVLSAVGSSDATANARVTRLAQSWQARHGLPVVPAFVSTAKPEVPAAIAELRARGVRRLAVASWFLAPGLLPDRVAKLAAEADPTVLVAAPLCPDPRVVELVLRRYEAAVQSSSRALRVSKGIFATADAAQGTRRSAGLGRTRDSGHHECYEL